MKIFTSFLVIISSFSLSQTNSIKQITDFDFDSRNPVFLQYPANLPWFSPNSEIFFEGINNDSLTSIYSLKYDAQLDSFYQLTQISDSGFINKNAAGKFIDDGYNGYKLLLWETNENGNWDIVFSIDSGNGWLPQSSLFASQEDELNPSFMQNRYYRDLPIEILYSKSNSVYLYSKKLLSEKNELIFEGNDSINYSDPVGAFSIYEEIEYAAAVKNEEGKAPVIVCCSKNVEDTLWREIKEVYESIPGVKPKFVNLGFDITLSYEGLFGEKRKVFLIPAMYFGLNYPPEELLEDTTLETTDFSAFFFEIVTKRSTSNTFEDWMPNCFKFIRNDSTFIRTRAAYYYLDPYLNIYTKVSDPKPGIGPLSVTEQGVISYTLWADSSNGRINLFGQKRVDPLGDVKRDLSPEGFSLSQNYPNPFNPNTKIHYAVARRQFVNLAVYDILGRDIITLVNEEKPAGEYEIEFDGATFPAEFIFIS